MSLARAASQGLCVLSKGERNPVRCARALLTGAKNAPVHPSGGGRRVGAQAPAAGVRTHMCTSPPPQGPRLVPSLVPLLLGRLPLPLTAPLSPPVRPQGSVPIRPHVPQPPAWQP